MIIESTPAACSGPARSAPTSAARSCAVNEPLSRRWYVSRVTLAGSSSPGRSSSTRTCSMPYFTSRSEEHTSELQSLTNLVCRLLLEKKKTNQLTTQLNTGHSGTLGATMAHTAMRILDSPQISSGSANSLLQSPQALHACEQQLQTTT